MAVTNAMFIFEVVVQSVKSMIESTNLIIRSEFADIFSLELKDPKQMHIVIPEPLPLPPAPPGKKGRKKKKAKPKRKKGKKKKGKVVEAPPSEPVIQSGQSVLFSSSAELLIQNMKRFPLELSLWNKEENLSYIGSISIPWDPIFLQYLETIYKCQDTPPVTLNEEYNLFEEGTAKLIAKIGIQVKLSYLGDKVTAAFRTLSEDPVIKKVLYTGMNSKTTSYMCTMKTTDEIFVENCNKIENNFVKDKPQPNKIIYADYKNAPGAKYNIFNDGDYCCMNNADKPPNTIYKAPETCPDIDFIADYVRKIIASCNDNMRMLTPRPTIKPRIKATDIDRLCYCKETKWPENEISQRFKNEVQNEPCPKCLSTEKEARSNTNVTCFDIANIRGPCGRHDCRIARDMRAYIENLVEEDKKEINIDEIFGPCGSKECTLAEKIQEFLRREGIFNQSNTLEGLSTQCACIKQMQTSLKKRKSCDTICSEDCDTSDSGTNYCDTKDCPFRENTEPKQVYDVYYFFVQYDFDKKSNTSSPADSNKSSTFQYCSSLCPSMKTSEKTFCTKSACSFSLNTKENMPNCYINEANEEQNNYLSPVDSNVVIHFEDIRNPCYVKSCNVVDVVKDFIVEGAQSERKLDEALEPCYCDCECSFRFSKKTTYCAVCGGYECLGDDLKDLPQHAKPYPCPVYHKQYDKKYIKVTSPWPEEQVPEKQPDNLNVKSSKVGGASRGAYSEKKSKVTHSVRSLSDRRSDRRSYRRSDRRSEQKSDRRSENKIKNAIKVRSLKKPKPKPKPEISKVEKISPLVEKKPDIKYPYPAVPKNMGWLWNAEDIPGMKVRPKWRPGAANKILVRRYKAVREGVDIIAKKKRAMMQRKKKLEMKPTLVVKKCNGEYTVQMEVFKKYSKDRLHFQYPYDEKPPLIYIIGKTAEEKAKIHKKKERIERRETRRKCRLLQSTFRNKCQEICLKAYNQAIGLLPLPDPNKPDCPCYTDSVKNLSPPIDSCSCSDEENISSSDTDNDDWIIEFIPPLARWDTKVKHPPVLLENECQYNYLDFKVKLLDKSGNPVPRYFKGPDGKQECSDLGGFWGPKHDWLEINKDGYIGPDNRWVPMNFIGPDGMFYSAEDGFFTDNTGRNLQIGVDGFIDKDGKWAWYCNKKIPRSEKSKTLSSIATRDFKKSKIDTTQVISKDRLHDNSEKSPPSNLKENNEQKYSKSAVITTGKGKVNKSVSYSSPKTNNQLIMSVSVDQIKYKALQKPRAANNVIRNRFGKYNEIMQLQTYDEEIELKLHTNADRVSNTTRKKISPFTIRRKYPGKLESLVT